VNAGGRPRSGDLYFPARRCSLETLWLPGKKLGVRHRRATVFAPARILEGQITARSSYGEISAHVPGPLLMLLMLLIAPDARAPARAATALNATQFGVMITKTFFTAKTFRAHSTNLFRQEKSLRGNEAYIG
jgi:hypothetical protein